MVISVNLITKKDVLVDVFFCMFRLDSIVVHAVIISIKIV